MACAAALWLREAPRYRARVVRQVWPPQGEHCQSCSSAVQPRRFCGLKRFGALRAITQTREKAKCCRVADARSTNAYKGGLSSWHPRGSASSQARRRVEAELEKYPQDCSRSSKRPLAVGHLQIARSQAGEAAVRAPYKRSGAQGVKDGSADSAVSTRVHPHAAIPGLTKASST